MELGHHRPALPTDVRDSCLYLYVVIYGWNLKALTSNLAERKDPKIFVGRESRDCMRERISKGREQPLDLRADNGSSMRDATRESRLEALGVLRSFFRTRVRNGSTYAASAFRSVTNRLPEAISQCGRENMEEMFFEWLSKGVVAILKEQKMGPSSSILGVGTQGKVN